MKCMCNSKKEKDAQEKEAPKKVYRLVWDVPMKFPNPTRKGYWNTSLKEVEMEQKVLSEAFPSRNYRIEKGTFHDLIAESIKQHTMNFALSFFDLVASDGIEMGEKTEENNLKNAQ